MSPILRRVLVPSSSLINQLEIYRAALIFDSYYSAFSVSAKPIGRTVSKILISIILPPLFLLWANWIEEFPFLCAIDPFFEFHNNLVRLLRIARFQGECFCHHLPSSKLEFPRIQFSWHSIGLSSFSYIDCEDFAYHKCSELCKTEHPCITRSTRYLFSSHNNENTNMNITRLAIIQQHQALTREWKRKKNCCVHYK